MEFTSHVLLRFGGVFITTAFQCLKSTITAAELEVKLVMLHASLLAFIFDAFEYVSLLSKLSFHLKIFL